MTVETSQKGFFVYTDLWDDGWNAKIDGIKTPVRKAFGTYKGIELAAGKYYVEFYFIDKILISIIIMNFIFFICLFWLCANSIKNQY
jgi:uncharacterized membrane protein YfhO